VNNQEAKEVLLCYRPGLDDRDDPDFAAALELVERDANLARWFEEQCAVQRALRAKFHQIPVPEGLREQILSERKARMAPPPPLRRKVFIAMAAACAVVLLLAVGIVLVKHESRPTFTMFQTNYVPRTVLRSYPRMDLETNDLSEIRSYLADNKGHADYHLPAGLENTSGTGCAILSWRGQRVTMVCFNSGKTKPATNPDLFLFIVDKTAFSHAPAAATPQYAQVRRLATATWTSGSETYLLAEVGNTDSLRKYLGDVN
jgi:hypothetical protein